MRHASLATASIVVALAARHPCSRTPVSAPTQLGRRRARDARALPGAAQDRHAQPARRRAPRPRSPVGTGSRARWT